MLERLPDSITSKMFTDRIDNLVEVRENNNVFGYRKYTKAISLNVTINKKNNQIVSTPFFTKKAVRKIRRQRKGLLSQLGRWKQETKK